MKELTHDDLAYIEADLRAHVFQSACRDCRRRVALADKIAKFLGG